MTDESVLAAGDFSSWVNEMRGAIRGERGAQVPCGGYEHRPKTCRTYDCRIFPPPGSK
jgi:hypothetical protein